MSRYTFPEETRSVLESLPQALVVYQFVDSKIETLILSDGFCELFGYTDRNKAYYELNNDLYKYDHPDDVARLSKAAIQFAKEDAKFDILYRSKSRNSSEYRIIHAIGKHVTAEDGSKLAYVSYTNEGIYTEESGKDEDAFSRSLNNALHEESLMKTNLYDSLTGLPSMTYFFQLAEDGKNRIEDGGEVPVLLYFDLVGMKFFNTKYSFSEGDKLLQSFARLLIRSFGSESCCHIGADHFAAFTHQEGLEELLTDLFHSCQKLNNNVSLPVHVGIYPKSMEDVPTSTACDRAKIACDALKNTYESAFNYYNSSMRETAERRQYILSHLDQAIEEKWIQVYYQPIIRAVNSKISDEEALARWIDPVKGFLSPAEFIPFLEDAKLIYKLDLFVVEQILEKLKQQERMGSVTVPQSVNLSRSDFDACDIVEEIRSRVDASGISRNMLTIEITESIIGADYDFMKKQVERFRELGFAVWMDDFGSGYSSLDVLQSIKFDLIKFDMSFMQRLDESDSGKIILTELMKMAAALGLDTVCEGVETSDQAGLLKEIGCSKLQGYYFSKPTPLNILLEGYAKEPKIGYENPVETEYYEKIGRVNLYDLTVMAKEDSNALHNFLNTLPTGIIELREDSIEYIRTNQAYRDFVKLFFHVTITEDNKKFDIPANQKYSPFTNLLKQCINGNRALLDEQMPDGSIVHSFARQVGYNPITGKTAIAVAVLSITEENDGTTYAYIARALAADYYNIYYVNLENDQFIEYSSPVGGEELAMERHGENFFDAVNHDTMTRIYEEDRAPFLEKFSKEKIIDALDKQGVFTITYRLIDTGSPMYANMKITRMQHNSSRLIIGISIIDAQMKQQEIAERMEREAAAYKRIMALTGDYLSLYTIEPESGNYIEFSTTDEYESLGLAKTGEDFYLRGIEDGKKAVYPEDLPQYLSQFSKESILRSIREKGQYQIHYRLILNGVPKQVSLKIVSVTERDGVKLIAGVRAWRERN